MRRAYHLAIVRRPSRRAATVDIALLDPAADPIRQTLGMPVAWLCKELAGGTSPRLMLRQCMARALEVQLPLADDAGKGILTRLVNGPSSSAVAAALTLGWQLVAGCRWRTAAGFELDLLTESPLTVKKLAEEDATKLSWRRAADRHMHLAHLDGVPYLPAVHRLLADTGSLTIRQ